MTDEKRVLGREILTVDNGRLCSPNCRFYFKPTVCAVVRDALLVEKYEGANMNVRPQACKDHEVGLVRGPGEEEQ